MAKPAKRKIDSDTSGSESAAPKQASGPKQPRVSKRITLPEGKQGSGVDQRSGRVTPSRNTARPSPTWVPVLMFSLWALGLVVIVLNYMEVLPSTDSLSGWYLIAGLSSILGGILVATQYR